MSIYNQIDRVDLAEEEGNDFATTLGNKKAALLQSNIILSVGKSTEETIEESGSIKTS